MSYDVIQQTLIEHNEKWKQKNEALLASATALSQQHKFWEASIALARHGESEQRRLRLWANAKREYHIEENA